MPGTVIIVAIVIGVIVLGLIGWVVGVYNRLVTLRNRFKNAFAQIDVQLKRRYDLIPNLVETAKGYMAHEKGTLEAVIKARQTAIDASSVGDQAKAENMLTASGNSPRFGLSNEHHADVARPQALRSRED